jgi:hypothetical protein
LREEISIQGQELKGVSINRDRFAALVAKQTQLFTTAKQMVTKLERKSPAVFDGTFKRQQMRFDFGRLADELVELFRAVAANEVKDGTKIDNRSYMI